MAYINGKRLLNATLTRSEGYQEGYDAGYNDGVKQAEDAYNLGLSEGKEAEWSVLWDAIQQKGERVNYSYLFSGKGWNDNTFKPKYDIVPNGGNSAYGMNSAFYTTGITDMAAALERAGVILDTSKERQLNYAFGNSLLTHIPTISLVSATTGTNRIFYYNANLKTIDKVIVTENNTYEKWFSNSPALENITFEGVIGNDLDMSPCPLLTSASVKSIVDCLCVMDFSDSNWGNKTLTMSQSAWGRFEEAYPFTEYAPPNTPGGTMDWATYITYIGWNLALA